MLKRISVRRASLKGINVLVRSKKDEEEFFPMVEHASDLKRHSDGQGKDAITSSDTTACDWTETVVRRPSRSRSKMWRRQEMFHTTQRDSKGMRIKKWKGGVGKEEGTNPLSQVR